MIRVTVAGADERGRGEIAAALAKQGDFSVTGADDDGFEIIRSAVKGLSDVIVMNYRMRGFTATDLARAVRRNSPATAVVVLYSPGDVLLPNDDLRAGVSGFLCGRDDAGGLVPAVRCVSLGGLYIGDAIRARCAGWFSPEPPERTGAARQPFSLTELQIFRGIALGSSDGEIARDLNMCIGSIRNCVHWAKRKSGQRNRTQLVLHALNSGLISLDRGRPEKNKK